jgi:hypothetical protein
MRKITHSRIIKASDVKVEGQFVLEIMPIEPKEQKQTSTDLVEPQVRILQSESEYSVIEITCSCGESIHLRCDYTAGKTPVVPQQTVTPEVPQKNVETEAPQKSVESETPKKSEPEVTKKEKAEGEKEDAS